MTVESAPDKAREMRARRAAKARGLELRRRPRPGWELVDGDRVLAAELDLEQALELAEARPKLPRRRRSDAGVPKT